MMGPRGSSGGGGSAAGVHPPATRMATTRTSAAADPARRMLVLLSQPVVQATLAAEPRRVAIARLWTPRSLIGGTYGGAPAPPCR
jgi:hypothetical protein